MFARTSSSGLLALSLLAALSAALSMSAFSEPALADVPAFAEGIEPTDELGSADPSALDSEALAPGALESAENTVDNTVETANYSDGKVSIDYPATWQVEVDESGEVGIANVPDSPLGLIQTRLYWVDAPPGPLVNANIDSFIEEGAAVGRYRSVTIDDRSALVIWLAERPGDLTSAIATFIGYGDETVFLFSRYSPENADAEARILSLHGSFANLAESPVGAADDENEAVDEGESAGEDAFLSDEEPVLPTEELPLQNEEFQL